jgi:hypothetical protein
MTTKRLATLVGIVAFGLCSIFFLPRSAAQPTGLRLVQGKPALPVRVSGWEGTDAEITKNERDTLGAGTEFARKLYVHPNGWFGAQVSIVLSGRDISNSLHRPERCLGAQGWEILESEEVQIQTEGKRTFPVMRLHNRTIERGKNGTLSIPVEGYTYYWFIGEHALTASHWGRFFTDNRDRLFRGVDQRWAFITVTARIPSAPNPEDQSAHRKRADKELRDFIRYLAPSIHGDSVSYD